MSRSNRYFLNNLSDNGSIEIDIDIIKRRVDALVSSIFENFSLQVENCDGGLYVGLSGVSYMLYHLSKNSLLEANRRNYQKQALKYLELPLHEALKTGSSAHVTDRTGFLTGNVGVLAVASAVYKQCGDEKSSYSFLSQFIKAKDLLKPLNWFNNGGDELFVGRAGYLCGVLWLRRELKIEVIPDSEVHQMLNLIVESGKNFSQSVKSPIPLMYHYYGTQYLGAAHGLSGILFILLSFPEWLCSNSEAHQLVKCSVDAFLQLQTPSGNFPCAMDEIRGGRSTEEELVHWCHGAPGAVYLLVKAYMVFKEERYLNAAIKCGEVTWHKGLLRKGPGICHGVSGSGYVFLVLYQITKDVKYLHRANSFFNFIFSDEFRQARKPDSPFSLFEGWAGAVCFAADILQPESAVFPFFNLA